MKSTSTILSVLVSALLMLASCGMPDGSDFVFSGGAGGGEHGDVERDEDTGWQKRLGDYTSVETGQSLTGLCLNASCDSLFLAGDTGEVYLYDSYGVLNRLFRAEGVLDFEAAAFDPDSRAIYLATGEDHSLYKLLPPLYDSLEVIKSQIGLGGSDGHRDRIEALAWKDACTILLGNDNAPFLVAEFSPDSAYVRRIHEIPSVTSISDMCYDRESGHLWILDGKALSIVVLDGSFALVKKYSLSFLESKDRPEALALDRVHNTIWAGCDGTGLIYAISFDFD